MKNQLQQLQVSLVRTFSVIAVALITFSASSSIAFAAASGGQVQYRSIKMSDNAASGGSVPSGVGSGTNATYRVTFRAAGDNTQTYTIRGVVLDFCSGIELPPTYTTPGTPFIGDGSCPPPSNFDLGLTPTVDTAAYTYGNSGNATTVTGLGTTGDWTTAGLDFAGQQVTGTNKSQTLRMTNSGTAVTLTGGTDYTFSVSGITNPSDTGTFYARLITYTSATGDILNYTHSTPGNYRDYGGFALSTAKVVDVTAKVQETLTFCVSGTLDTTTAYPNTTLIPPDTCTPGTGGPTTPAITLGHGTNNTLDSSQIDKNTIWTLASTNALRGLTIRMHNSNPCGGLSTDNGATCEIPAIGTGSATPSNMRKGSTPSVGVAAFGMFCYDSPTGPIGQSNNIVVVGSTTCNSGYRDAAHTTFSSESASSPTTNDMYFGMDTTTTDDNVTSIFGDTVAASTGPVSNVLNRFDFAATASDTTPAGIYRANLAMIATGTF